MTGSKSCESDQNFVYGVSEIAQTRTSEYGVHKKRTFSSDRLGYWGIYDVVKDLAEIAGVKDAYPYQGRHTVATEMVSHGMDPIRC